MEYDMILDTLDSPIPLDLRVSLAVEAAREMMRSAGLGVEGCFTGVTYGKPPCYKGLI